MRVISGKARGTKLSSIESLDTRPTLDRVKEALFNIIQNKIEDSIVLDLFAGSGAIGIEFISRGCKEAYFCEKSSEAAKMIEQNLTKTKFTESSKLLVQDYKKALKKFQTENIAFDIIYIDPPYKADIAVEATRLIISMGLLKQNGIIIIETDEKERELEGLGELQVKIFDLRKYGRASLIFLNQEEVGKELN